MKQELIEYLQQRSIELDNEKIGLENRYDTMPDWGWARKSAITREQLKISKFIEYLEGVE